jgi:hypothetical protein
MKHKELKMFFVRYFLHENPDTSFASYSESKLNFADIFTKTDQEFERRVHLLVLADAANSQMSAGRDASHSNLVLGLNKKGRML